MGENEIRKYALLMQELDLTGLEITQESMKIRLERSPSTLSGASVPVPAVPNHMTKADTSVSDDLYQVISPMIGVFYSSPAENADAFVKKGDKVTPGDTLGIIEAMKLMNEISSEVAGTIEEICVKNGQVVEYGTVLFRVKR